MRRYSRASESTALSSRQGRPRAGSRSITSARSLPISCNSKRCSRRTCASASLGTACKTTLHTGTITAATPYSSTTLAAITDPSVADWTPYVNARLTWTSGAAVGCVCIVARDLGGGQARIGNSGILQDVVETNISFPIFVPPSTGAYVVELLPTLYMGLFDLMATNNGDIIEPLVDIRDVTFARTGVTGADPQPTGNGSVEFAFQGCIVLANQFDGTVWDSFISAHPNGIQVRSGTWFDMAGSVVNGVCQYIAGAVGAIYSYTLCEGCGFSYQQGAFLELNAAAAENAAPIGFANQFGDGVSGTATSFSPGTLSIRGPLVGAGNAGVGVRVPVGHTVVSSVVPTITGAGGDLALGVATTGEAWDDTAATYIAPKRALTWALIATSVAGGGFGGQAADVRHQSFFIGPDS